MRPIEKSLHRFMCSEHRLLCSIYIFICNYTETCVRYNKNKFKYAPLWNILRSCYIPIDYYLSLQTFMTAGYLQYILSFSFFFDLILRGKTPLQIAMVCMSVSESGKSLKPVVSTCMNRICAGVIR